MTTLTEKRFFEWHKDDVSVTLRNKSGSYGGGSEVLVICSMPIKDERPQRSQRNIRERNRNDIDITRKGATIDNGERSKTIDADGVRTASRLSGRMDGHR